MLVFDSTGRNPYGGRVPVPGIEPNVIYGGDVLVNGYPTEPPGMSIGSALILALEQAQAHGDIPQVTWDFDHFFDSHGDFWEVATTVSTKTLTDMFTFVREISATHVDIRMDPESWTLHAYRPKKMNRVNNGTVFLPGANVQGLEQTGTFKVKNTIVGVTQNSYFEVQDATSVANYGRKPVRLELGSVDNVWEAIRIIVEALALFSHEQEEINVQLTEPPYGYINYLLGELVTTYDHLDNETIERVMSLSVRMDTNGVARVTPSIKDVFLA